MIRQSTAAEPLLDIRRIGVYTVHERAAEAARRLERVLTKTNIELRIFNAGNGDYGNGISGGARYDPDDFDEQAASAAAERAAQQIADSTWKPDVLVVLGGDGAVLRALCRHHEFPVLAVNYGTVGFLSAGDDKDLERIVFQLLEGDYYIEQRAILTSVYDSENHHVINEVVVKGTTKMVSVDVWIDGTKIHTIRGDGVIVGTPTGSTSYLLSTGASIVMPTVDVMILSGINEYRFSSRSIVIPGDSRVRLRVHEDTRDTDVFVSHDGRDRRPLGIDESVEIFRGPERARLIFFDRHAFFKNLKERLDW